MANRPKSIKKALELGHVIRWDKRLDRNQKERYEIYVKFFAPIRFGDRWILRGEWFECSEKYFKSFVSNHRNFKA